MLSRWLAGLSALVIVLDQLSKVWIIRPFCLWRRSSYVLSVFNLVLAHNTGAAFSFLQRCGRDAALVVQRHCHRRLGVDRAGCCAGTVRKLLLSLALSLILGGALGNLIDRIAYGYVVDFLDLPLG